MHSLAGIPSGKPDPHHRPPAPSIRCRLGLRCLRWFSQSFDHRALINNVWSIAGPSGRKDVKSNDAPDFVSLEWYDDVSAYVRQLKAASDNVWTVPVGGGVVGFPLGISSQ